MTTQSNLISGSIWERVKAQGESSYSLVLCVTNEGLPTRVLEKHPQQVIFVTDQGKVLSMGVDDFCAKRSYYNFDADAAAAFEEIINPKEDSDDLIDGDDDGQASPIDSVVADETLFSPEHPPVQEEATAVNEEDGTGDAMSLNVGPHPLAEVLRANLVSYSESPFHTGDTLHTLKFILSGLTLTDIRDAFKISDPNAIQKFELTTATETFQVDIDGFVDVMLEADSWVTYGCLYITSEGDFRSPPEVADEEEGSSDVVIDMSAPAEVTAPAATSAIIVS